MNVSRLIGKKIINCVGCGSCKYICPNKAIDIKPNGEGFRFPEIDAEKCTECGECGRRCPARAKRSASAGDPNCYAVTASDEIRQKSTAGGAFSVLAKEYLKSGGDYICGVKLDGKTATYTLIDKEEELSQIIGAKYIEADTSDIFVQIKEKLDDKKRVLFCGTPCHTAALKQFVGEAEGLLTVDFVCHGVSSPKFLQMLCDNIEKQTDKKVDGFNFVYKENGYAPDVGEYVFEDGSTQLDREFFEHHNACHTLRKSCYNCRYAECPHLSDITLGFFYGIESFDNSINDGKGISLLITNTSTGEELFEQAVKGFETAVSVPVIFAVNFNRFFAEYIQDPHRDRLFSLLGKYDHDTMMRYLGKDYYDAVAVTNWSCNNFGVHLANYALYKVIESKGASVLMVEKPNIPPFPPMPNAFLFRNVPYPSYVLSPLFESFEELKTLNARCGGFIVGSDQLWNQLFYGHSTNVYDLSFAAADKPKISFSTSMGGGSFAGSGFEEKRLMLKLKKFKYVTVKSRQEAEYIKSNYDIDAKFILDPVFLADKSIYTELAQGSDAVCENTVTVYIIRTANGFEEQLAKQARAAKLSLITVKEPNTGIEYSDMPWGMPILSENLYCEDWLSYIISSAYIVTDSYYAICLAIIFEKPFTAVIPKDGIGTDMIVNLLSELDLQGRIVELKDDISDDILLGEIDYKEVKSKLDKLKEESEIMLEQMISLLLPKEEKEEAKDKEDK